MEEYIKKSALVAEIEKRKKQNEEWKNSCKGIGSLAARMVIQEDINILSLIDTLEVKEYYEEYDGFLGKELKMVDDEIERLEKLKVKEVDLESNDAMNTEVDDSNISCNSTFCSVHTTCKYFNPEKESNVKHCFGGVPMQLKQRKESAVKDVDLEKYYHDFLQKEWFDKNCSRTVSEMMAFTAKHFFELGLKAQKGIKL